MTPTQWNHNEGNQIAETLGEKREAQRIYLKTPWPLQIAWTKAEKL